MLCYLFLECRRPAYKLMPRYAYWYYQLSSAHETLLSEPGVLAGLQLLPTAYALPMLTAWFFALALFNRARGCDTSILLSGEKRGGAQHPVPVSPPL